MDQAGRQDAVGDGKGLAAARGSMSTNRTVEFGQFKQGGRKGTDHDADGYAF